MMVVSQSTEECRPTRKLAPTPKRLFGYGSNPTRSTSATTGVTRPVREQWILLLTRFGKPPSLTTTHTTFFCHPPPPNHSSPLPAKHARGLLGTPSLHSHTSVRSNSSQRRLAATQTSKR